MTKCPSCPKETTAGSVFLSCSKSTSRRTTKPVAATKTCPEKRLKLSLRQFFRLVNVTKVGKLGQLEKEGKLGQLEKEGEVGKVEEVEEVEKVDDVPTAGADGETFVKSSGAFLFIFGVVAGLKITSRRSGKNIVPFMAVAIFRASEAPW
jgi:hypothetical protein